MTDRQALLIQLLSKPFDDGYKRESSVRHEGKPSRYRLLTVLPVMYTNLKRHDRDGEISCD